MTDMLGPHSGWLPDTIGFRPRCERCGGIGYIGYDTGAERCPDCFFWKRKRPRNWMPAWERHLRDIRREGP